VQFYGDYHLHSTYSDGRSSIEEMVRAASLTDLEEICLADHGPRNFMVGIKSEQTLLKVKEKVAVLRTQYPALRIFTGVEANIIGLNGKLDVSKEITAELDLLIAGLHAYVWPDKIGDASWLIGNQVLRLWPSERKRLKNENTKALVEAIHHYNVDIISHPGLKMEIAYPEVARACLQEDTLWEINAGHKFPGEKEVRELACLGVNFVVNSDAHFPESVGALDYGSQVLEKAQVPLRQIINARGNADKRKVKMKC